LAAPSGSRRVSADGLGLLPKKLENITSPNAHEASLDEVPGENSRPMRFLHLFFVTLLLPSASLALSVTTVTVATTTAAADDVPVGNPDGDGDRGGGPLGGDVDDAASSLGGLGGYHGSVHVGGAVVYFAVGVFSELLPNGNENGIVAFDEPWKNVVGTFYHEIQEARSDPDVEDAIRTQNSNFIGWNSEQGEEIWDFPIFEASPLQEVFREVPLVNGGTAPIQLMYSNGVNGPEDPTT
jgi:hypothetical protein